MLVLKQYEATGISKQEVAKLAGVDTNCVQNWKTLYHTYGIEGLMKHNKTGFKPSVFTSKEHDLLEKKLNDLEIGLQVYFELKAWLENKVGKIFN
jgi:transposase